MELRSPALLMNLQILAAKDGYSNSMSVKLVAAQWRRSISIEAGPASAPVCALVFYPVDNETFEMCSLFAPEAAGQMLKLVRIGQLTLRKLVKDTGSSIFCIVHPGSPGERMAKVLGFQAGENTGKRLRMNYHG
jgi:hypothetical protein